MSSWSRDQSQSKGSMRQFASNSNVRALGNLSQFTEKQKASLRRANGVKSRWAKDDTRPEVVIRYRDQLAPLKEDFVPKRKRRGVSGCRLSDEKRAMVRDRLRRKEEWHRAN